MAVTVGGTSITFNDGSVQYSAASAGISAQNCSYTGGLVELAGINMNSSNSGTYDLGANRVMTGLRKSFDYCFSSNFIHVRGYSIKNTA